VPDNGYKSNITLFSRLTILSVSSLCKLRHLRSTVASMPGSLPNRLSADNDFRFDSECMPHFADPAQSPFSLGSVNYFHRCSVQAQCIKELRNCRSGYDARSCGFRPLCHRGDGTIYPRYVPHVSPAVQSSPLPISVLLDLKSWRSNLTLFQQFRHFPSLHIPFECGMSIEWKTTV
jgi:hypothetical protein